MRIIFIGQAAFGKDSLAALLDQGETVVGAVTIPDVPNQKAPNPVKVLAAERNIPLLQPARLKSPAAIAWVADLQPDLLVLAFVTSFVPQEMIDLATHGGINYHPSLLPKYRGGSAINWAIINGETQTGVTIHQIDAGVDTGPIILQQKVDIAPDDTVKSLYFDKLYPLGIGMVSEAVRLIREKKARPVAQDETMASFQPVITDADTIIDWKQPTLKVYNLIRGANPSPGAVTSLKGSRFKIWEAAPYPLQGPAGSVIEMTADGFVVSTGDGGLLIQRVQPQGSAKISAADFAAAVALKSGSRLG